MLKAKDTAMSGRDAVFDPIQDQIQRLLLCQAEISFKAGIREVLGFTAREFGVDWSDEKEQLKEWGIK